MVRILIMEGEEMINIPNFKAITPEQWAQVKNVAIGFAIWTLASIIAYYYVLPDEWKWIAYAPAAFLLFAFWITAAIIPLRQFYPKPIAFVYVGRKRVTACQYCPMSETKDNIVNSKFPVVKCMETAKVCYTPMAIARWCPYAK